MCKACLFATTLLFVVLSASSANACDRAIGTVYRSRTVRVVAPHMYAPRARYIVYKPEGRIENTPRPLPLRSQSLRQTPEVIAQTTVVRSHATINIHGEFFGAVPGRVFVRLEGVRLAADVLAWEQDRVMVQLPEVTVTKPAGVAAKLQVFTANGQLQKELSIVLRAAFAEIEEVAHVAPLEPLEEVPVLK